MKLPINYNKASAAERKLAREEYINLQHSKCHFCKCSLHNLPRDDIYRKSINWGLFPANFQQFPIHLHHNHKTGMTIGAVHMKCNAVLFQYYGE